MIMDVRNTFLTATAVSATAGTALAGDVIDLGAATQSISVGMPPKYVMILVTTAFASAGAATVNFTVASDAAAAIATDGTASDHAQTGPLPYAELTAGTKIILALNSGHPIFERYLGLLVTTGAATTTAGSITAAIVETPANWTSYPDATN